MAYVLIENEQFNLALIYHDEQPGGIIVEAFGKPEKEKAMRIQKFKGEEKDKLIAIIRDKETQLIGEFEGISGIKIPRTAMREYCDAELNNYYFSL